MRRKKKTRQNARLGHQKVPKGSVKIPADSQRRKSEKGNLPKNYPRLHKKEQREKRKKEGAQKGGDTLSSDGVV